MGLFGRLFNEFIDVIEWQDDTHDTMVYRFERYGNEIKYSAKLIVREAQYAIFVNEGEVADVLGPGTYELETRNLPVLTTLQNWHHGFQSPFKAEVYFVNARRFTDLKWGTRQPLMIRDSEFGGLRVRAFGTYTVRVIDPLKFIREIVGTDGVFTTDEIGNQLRNLINSRFASIIGNAGIPVLDMAANYDQLGEFLTRRIAPEFAEYGLELTRVLVENISLPEQVSEALDQRTSMGMIGNLDQWLKYQTGTALATGAATPGSGIGDGMGLGVGLAVGQRLGQGNRSGAVSGATVLPHDEEVPPALPHPVIHWHIAEKGEAMGPLTVDNLRSRVNAGEFGPDDLAWKPGMVEWERAGDIEALNSLFAQQSNTPPPLPKA